MANSAEDQLIALVGEFALDPLGFVLAVYPWGEAGTELEHAAGPRTWQREVLQALGDRLSAGYEPGKALMPVLQAIASGHGIGKSALIAWIIWWAMSTMPDCKVVLTANTEPQLRTKTWPELAKWARMAINAHWFDVQGLSVVAREESRRKTWRADAVTWSETNLEAFAGLHNLGKRIVLLFDEASGIASSVWETAEGALTDVGTEIIWLALGNPTQPTGKFFECFGAQRDRWHGKKIDSRQVEGVNLAQIEEWREAYGEDSDFFRVRVRGEFPRVGSMQFISPEVVAEAAKREPHPLMSDALIMGVDVSRSGQDSSVISFRRGRDARLHPWIKMKGNCDTMQLAGKIVELYRELKCDAVFIDGGGVGGGVVDRVKQLGLVPFEVQFGGKSDGGSAGGFSSPYANKRSEIWGAMRDWLEVGTIPNDADLRTDLEGPEYGYAVVGGRDVIQLERKQDMKKRGLSSPDAADALAVTFAYSVIKATAGEYAAAPTILPTEYDLYA